MIARRFAPLALLLSLSMAAGCQFDIDETLNTFPDALPDVPVEASEGMCDCLQVGDWYRFTTLRPTRLAGDDRHPLVLTLRNLWDKDIERYELNVIFVITAVDGDRFSLRVMNAARGELGTGEICRLPETAVDLDFVRDADDPCRVRMARRQRINIYAGTPENPRNCAPRLDVLHAIPVTGIQLEARIAPDCSSLTEGFAENAGIPEPSLPEICTCPGLNGPAEMCGDIDPDYADGSCNGCNGNYQNLQELMTLLNLGVPLPADCPDDDGVPGVCIDAEFDGARWEMGEPPLCP